MPKKADSVGVEGIGTENVTVTPQAVAAGVVPDVFTEVCHVSLATPGKGELLMEARTESVDIDLGEKGVEFLPTLKGGRLTKFTPMADSTITLECRFTQAGTAAWPAASTSKAGEGLYDIFQAEDGTQPLSYGLTSIARNMVRLTLAWVDAATLTGGAALGTIVTTTTGLRMSFADGYITTIKPAMSADDGLKFSITLKFPAVDSSAAACCQIDSCDSSAQISALSAYTTTTKF